MPEPTYRIAQRLHERRAAVGLPKYGRYLDADSQGCMLVHALEEAADQVNYLLAEIQRRKNALEVLFAMANTHRHEAHIRRSVEEVIDLLGGWEMIAQYDEILGGGTVAENATVDHRDEALRVAQEALEAIDHLVFTRGVTMDGKGHWQLHIPGQSEAIEKVRAALAAIRAAGGAR